MTAAKANLWRFLQILSLSDGSTLEAKGASLEKALKAGRQQVSLLTEEAASTTAAGQDCSSSCGLTVRPREARQKARSV